MSTELFVIPSAVPFEKTVELHKLINNSALKSYPHAAHGLMFQYPDDLAKTLIAFIDN